MSRDVRVKVGWTGCHLNTPGGKGGEWKVRETTEEEKEEEEEEEEEKEGAWGSEGRSGGVAYI